MAVRPTPGDMSGTSHPAPSGRSTGATRKGRLRLSVRQQKASARRHFGQHAHVGRRHREPRHAPGPQKDLAAIGQAE